MKGRLTKLDDIDRKILSILQTNAKLTNTRLADKVGLSAAPTLERVKKLEKNGYIEAYHARLSYAKLGIEVMAYVCIELQKQDATTRKRFLKLVNEHAYCAACYHVSGMADYLLKIIAHSLADYQKTILDLTTRMDGFIRARAMVVLSTEKEKNSVPLS